MTELLKIAQLGNPILRCKAELVANITDSSLVKLIDSMIATAIASKAVGIAAPQVSYSLRLFIVASHPNKRYPQAPVMQPTAMIDPQIISHGEEINQDWEGCLSIPGIRGLVPRYQEITVEYWTREGEKQQQILTGFIARIFQHELDHLDGLVFLDRLTSSRDLYTEQEYQRIISE